MSDFLWFVFFCLLEVSNAYGFLTGINKKEFLAASICITSFIVIAKGIFKVME